MKRPRHHRNWILTIIWAALFAPTLVSQQRLTLSEAAARALENNPDLVAHAPGQQAARAEFKAAKAGYLPRLDFEQSYLAGNNPVFVFSTLLSQRRFTAANFALPELNNPSAIDNLQTRATVQQTIWDFGRTRSMREQARLGIDIADQTYQDHVRGAMLAVFESYYFTSLARDTLETARIALRSAEALEQQAKTRVDSGLAVEADLLRSRVHLSAAKQQEIQAQGELERARARLNRLMGYGLDRAAGETAPLAIRELVLPSEETLIEEQKRHRPDYENLLAQLQREQAVVRSLEKEFLPVITGYTTWEADNPSLNIYGGSNWAAGITLRWNLFSGGSDRARLEAARHRLEQKRRQLSAIESAMALELRDALIQYRAAQQQVEAARAAAAQSDEGLRILRNRYDAGLATMTDLLSAETARSSARTSLSQAVFQQLLSFARVEYAAGILSPTSPAMNLD